MSSNGETVVKKHYGGSTTVQGRDLIAGLIAGETIEFTRIVVGSGLMPQDIEPMDMTDLVEPVAEATSTVPMVENNVLSMIVEYRNDMNGGLKEGFWIYEFGIFAKTDKRPECLIYYATLGDSPQPINAYQDDRIDIRRYPVTIALAINADVQVAYNPGAFITAHEAQALIGQMVDKVTEKANLGIKIFEIEIPVSSWSLIDSPSDCYKYQATVSNSAILAKLYPDVTIIKECQPTAQKAGICAVSETFDGGIYFWAEELPEDDITATLKLITQMTPSTEGDNGEGGCACPPLASDEEVADAVSSVFGALPDGVEVATDEEVADLANDIFFPSN